MTQMSQFNEKKKRYRQEMYVITLHIIWRFCNAQQLIFRSQTRGSPQEATGSKGYQKQRRPLFSKIYDSYIWFKK